MMTISARSLLEAVALAALLVLTAWLLNRLAQCQTTAQLRDSAALALALAATGDTSYRWSFRGAEDIVAGRVFGARDYAFEDGELVVRSSGSAFEIGLPLPRPVDLRRFPHLHISATATAPAELRIVARERLDAPARISAAIPLPAGASKLSLDLIALSWTEQAHAAPPPQSAAMLRLRIDLAAGSTLHLRTASLERIDGAQRIELAQTPRIVDPAKVVPADSTIIYRLPLGAEAQASAITALAKSVDVHSMPLILLPQDGRVERQLLLRNAIFTALPAAIPIPENALAATFAQARIEASVAPPTPAAPWMALAVYALILGALRYRPARNPRLRALTEIVLVLVGPLWLILGGRLDGNPDPSQLILIALTLAYAISLSLPRHWRWNGSARAWLLAAVVVALAAIVGSIGHRPDSALRTIGGGHIARYLAWALLQQFLICAVCTGRWHIVTGNAALAAYLGALGFALMHTPNATLMLATLCGGLCWCALYLRERALLPLAVSHAASALLLLALLPPDVLLSAEVGVRFFQ